ncbi:hypothetical protein FQR65_LT18342 [Abscondita terminalis]|nr:hypothetical protein FQR65_LT18342 [Abscondita terminalis]
MDWLGDTREKSASRRRISTARASRPSAAIRRRRKSLLDHADAIGAEISGCSARLQLFRRSPAMGLWRARNSASALAYPAAGAAPTSCSTLGGWPAESVRATLARAAAGRAHGLLQLRCPAASRSCPVSRRYPGRGHNPHARRCGAEPGQHGGSIPIPMPSSAWSNDKDLAGDRQAGARAVTTGIAPACRAPRRQRERWPSRFSFFSWQAFGRAGRRRKPLRASLRRLSAAALPPRANARARMIESGVRQERGQSGLYSARFGPPALLRQVADAVRRKRRKEFSSMGFFNAKILYRPGAVHQTGGRVPSEVQAAELRGRARRRLEALIALAWPLCHRAAMNVLDPSRSGIRQHSHQGAERQHAVPAPGERAADRRAVASGAGAGQTPTPGAAPTEPTVGAIPTPPPVVFVAAAVARSAAYRHASAPAAQPATQPAKPATPPAKPDPKPEPSLPPSRKCAPMTAPARWPCWKAAAPGGGRLAPSRPRPRAISYCDQLPYTRPRTRSSARTSCTRPADQRVRRAGFGGRQAAYRLARGAVPFA